NEKVLNDFAETLRQYNIENQNLARLIYRFFEEIDAIWKVLGKDRTCNTVLREHRIAEGIIKEEEEEEEEEEKHEEKEVWATLVAMTLTKFPNPTHTKSATTTGKVLTPVLNNLGHLNLNLRNYGSISMGSLSQCNGFQIQTRSRGSDTLTVTSSTTVRRTSSGS
ncbi:hypothetical protein TVAGG3_0473220, partial [Trichomonas vaginalis G3]|uniref:hypothetical protein n=1 Tax=Trichomonas vaginalis (strain ATCC PRA-98 / G3) TaxID=412133 RepID=UPI0021E5D1B8